MAEPALGRESRRLALPSPSLRLVRTPEEIPWSEVVARGWIVYEGGVYDLKGYEARHPGGRFLHHLRGVDATGLLKNAHHESSPVFRILERFRVGTLDTSTQDPVDKAYGELRESLTREGMFEYPRKWLALDFLRMALLFGIALTVTGVSPWWGVLPWTIASLDLVWWIHDAGHNSIFRTERSARAAIEILGSIFIGMPQRGYHFVVHRIHHGFTNMIGMDRALETGPVIWHRAMEGRSRPWIVAIQAILWTCVILPLTAPLMILTGLVFCVKKRLYWNFLGIFLRWGLVLHFVFGGEWLPMVLPTLITGFVLGLAASLNHFHLPMDHAASSSMTRAIFWRTQNLDDRSWFWTWLTGGLNRHIEHHLFSNMPRRNLARIQDRVRRFASTHGLSYRTCSQMEAFRQLWNALKDPQGEALHDESSALEAASAEADASSWKP